MLTAKYFNAAGEPGEAFQLPEELFDGVVNDAVLHQVVKATLANRRQGNAATKTRANVSGGARKPWRQKGTGRARQGSIRAPHWRGGGIVFGPQPRDYRTEIPRKVKQLARKSALNARAVILAPVVSEKSYALIEDNRYSFRVHPDAHKTQIRQAIEQLFDVGVVDVKTMSVKSKPKRRGYTSGRTRQWKKAIVQVKPGDTIPIFQGLQGLEEG